jgi:hypothetical protein
MITSTTAQPARKLTFYPEKGKGATAGERIIQLSRETDQQVLRLRHLAKIFSELADDIESGKMPQRINIGSYTNTVADYLRAVKIWVAEIKVCANSLSEAERTSLLRVEGKAKARPDDYTYTFKCARTEKTVSITFYLLAIELETQYWRGFKYENVPVQINRLPVGLTVTIGECSHFYEPQDIDAALKGCDWDNLMETLAADTVSRYLDKAAS